MDYLLWTSKKNLPAPRIAQENRQINSDHNTQRQRSKYTYNSHDCRSSKWYSLSFPPVELHTLLPGTRPDCSCTAVHNSLPLLPVCLRALYGGALNIRQNSLHLICSTLLAPEPTQCFWQQPLPASKCQSHSCISLQTTMFLPQSS